jgi:hypothetical protein
VNELPSKAASGVDDFLVVLAVIGVCVLFSGVICRTTPRHDAAVSEIPSLFCC